MNGAVRRLSTSYWSIGKSLDLSFDVVNSMLFYAIIVTKNYLIMELKDKQRDYVLF